MHYSTIATPEFHKGWLMLPIHKALAQRESMYVSPGTIAIAYTHLGEYDLAIERPRADFLFTQLGACHC